jgi:hypothetical protein
MTSLVYVLAYAAIPLFGMMLAAYPVSRIESRAARIGLAFLAGGLVLAVEATLFSIARIPWSIVGLSLPLSAVSLIVLVRGSKPPAHADAPRFRVTHAVILISFLHFVLSILTTQSVSPDYVLFWGVKSVRFAMASRLDADFLLSCYAPPHVDYPPLVPVMQAWGLLFSRRMPWITGAAMSSLWLIAPVPVIRWSLSRGHAADFAAAVSAFWTAAMASSFAFSGCGGNADAVLVAYISTAAVAIAAERYEPRCRWIAAMALAGAALTKVEALASIGAILVGMALRDLVKRDPHSIRRVVVLALATTASVCLWFSFQYRFGLPVGYQRFTSFRGFIPGNLSIILRETPKNLAAGCWGLSWLIPLAVVFYVAVRAPRRLIDALPLLIPLPLLFAFFAFLFLQYPTGLQMQMWWILPRISQPVLSLLILGAAFACGPEEQSFPA